MREIASKRKLSLTRTTLRVLSSVELGRVAGAIVGPITTDCHSEGTPIPTPTQQEGCTVPPPDPPPHIFTTISRVGTLLRDG